MENPIPEILESPIKTKSTLLPIEKKYNATCKLITGYGTGFFCKINIKKKQFKFLFTNNTVINENQLINGSRIKIYYNNELHYIDITYKRFTCTNENLNYTCIEIFDDDKIENFFDIDSNINSNDPNLEYQNEEINLIEYPKGDEIIFCEGHIKEIKNNEIFHSIKTIRNSSGTPIILPLRNYNVIGIHCGSLRDDKGIFFKDIISDIEKQKNILTKFKPINHYSFKGKIYDLFTKNQFEEYKERWFFFILLILVCKKRFILIEFFFSK